jgi:ribosome biogenesis protein ENP2
MVLQVSNPNNVKIYTVSGSGHRSIPDWLERKKKRVLKNDPGIVILLLGVRFKRKL